MEWYSIQDRKFDIRNRERKERRKKKLVLKRDRERNEWMQDRKFGMIKRKRNEWMNEWMNAR